MVTVVPAFDRMRVCVSRGGDMNLVAGSKDASAITAEIAIPPSQQTRFYEDGFSESVFHHLRIQVPELLA